MDTIPAPSQNRALHVLLDIILLLDRRVSSARQVAFPRVLEVLLARHVRTDLSLLLVHPRAVLALFDW
jgi:hypothetical protein